MRVSTCRRERGPTICCRACCGCIGRRAALAAAGRARRMHDRVPRRPRNDGRSAAWWAWCMATNPAAQAAARDVSRVLGGCAPSAETRASLRYLTHTLEETLRLYPSAPILISRRASTDRAGAVAVSREDAVHAAAAAHAARSEMVCGTRCIPSGTLRGRCAGRAAGPTCRSVPARAYASGNTWR